jgi:hypothetical protein
MKLHALGIDLGKTVFHLVGLDSTGRLVIRSLSFATSCPKGRARTHLMSLPRMIQ